MIEISLTEIIVAFITAMSIPSAITGLIVWRLQKKMDAADKKATERTASQIKLLVSIIKGEQASIALGEANAHALQLGHSNGDTEKALAYATDVKHQQKTLLTELGIHSLFDDD